MSILKGFPLISINRYLSSHSIKNLRRQCGFHKGLTVDPIGRAGGLCIWWKPSMEIEFLDVTKNWIDAVVKVPSDSFYGRCTWVYGTPYNNEKVEFWETLKAWGVKITFPGWLWVI
ncbi:unnamed protein product [Prunus armeniaca]